MSKYNTLFDGKSLADHFPNESGYNYYGFLGVDGTWVILRESTTQTEYRVAVGSDRTTPYSSAIILRASQNYKRHNEFGFKTV